MIITVNKLREYVTTNLSDAVLEEKLQALEVAIRKYTNNNFQNRNIRILCDIQNNVLTKSLTYINIGDTVQISDSAFNEGLYVVTGKTDYSITLDSSLYDEVMITATKVEYPANVKMGVINIMRWQLKNEDQNYNPAADKDVQSESISRHSVTYAKDQTESDLFIEFGVPKKYVAFLNQYKKARF